MIVAWSETYLRTSLTAAFGEIRASPPDVQQYLVEPTPSVERHAPPTTATPPSSTLMSSRVNRTDQERRAAVGATKTPSTSTTQSAASNASWQENLPEVCEMRRDA